METSILKVHIVEDEAEYLRRHPPGEMSLVELWRELDSVWDAFGLDNEKPLESQAISAYYAHPVWVLNGLFTAADKESNDHRTAIASYISKLSCRRVADYGGGFGVLAGKLAAISNGEIAVHVIEPYSSKSGVASVEGLKNVTFRQSFQGEYDIVVAQDVLEHLENPIEIALSMVEATRHDGYLVFANCFYPVIKCHLPGTFYLRHTFGYVMRHAGLKYIGRVPGAPHAMCFRRDGEIRRERIAVANKRAKAFGPLLNGLTSSAKSSAKAVINLVKSWK